MIGGSLSKWTMSYFAVALAWLFAAELLMVVGFGYPAADIGSPDTLVVVHMVCVGWLSMAMCGALFQFVPVLVAKPLFAQRWELPAFGLLAAGLVALLAGFLALGGRLPAWLWLLPFGATLLVAGFGVVVIDLALTVWRTSPPMGPAHFVLVGLASLCATAALGSAFAWSLAGHGGRPLLAILDSGISLHAIAGLGGWLTLTAMGVSYRLLSMFMLSPDVEGRRSMITLLAGAVSVGLVVTGGLSAIATQTGLQAALLSGAVFGLGTIVLYGRDVAALYRNRKRRELELNTRMAAYGIASLAAAALLGIGLILTGSFFTHGGAFAFLVAFGWLSGLILAKLYKIVAFLTWLETYGPAMGRVPTPRVQDLVAEPRAAKWFAAYFVSVWIATVALMAETPTGFRLAVLAMTVATAGIARQLVRTRRLREVAEPLRLPNGTRCPRLLCCRN
jgi:hypothetical protein